MRTRCKRVMVLASGALVLPLFTASPALADGDSVLRADLVGSMPDGPVMAGIRPGGAPWVTEEDSSVRVREDGRIRVRLEGLVIPIAPFNGTNPVASAVATLVCGEVVADSTDPFALDSAGNGSTRDTLTLPEDCADPNVLIQPAGNRAIYIAFTESEHEDDD